jgi:hypothetical protein
MKQMQAGSSLVVALVMLTIITLVAVYSIEGSTIQSKMVASSLFSTLTYQECRNEQEANIRYYNGVQGSQRRATLQELVYADPVADEDGNLSPKIIRTKKPGEIEGLTPFTKQYNDHPSKSDIYYDWIYVKINNYTLGGDNIDTEKQTTGYEFEHTCTASFRFASNSQTLGTIVEGLVQAGTLTEN